MKKRGFTLIEMLGVITVLAILTMIVVPMVINQLRSKKDQIRKSVLNSINASAALYIDRNKATFAGQVNSCVKISDLVDNDLLDNSIYNYEELGVDLKNAYILTRSYDKEPELSLSCSPIYVTYNNGASIYFNPETGNVCSNPKTGTGVKQDCMKWYIFNDSKNSANVTAILDHNTTPVIGVSSIETTLASDVSTWSTDIRSNARLITADEVAKITGADKTLSWVSTKSYTSSNPTIGTNISTFYLDGAYGSNGYWKARVANASGASKYAWLYDYTYCKDGTTSTGCNIIDNKTTYYISTYNNLYIQGYWTSTSVTGESGKTWIVDMYGSLSLGDNSQIFKNGIRPVISIPKAKLK